MARESAGLVCFRHGPAGLEVLLVHPGGPFWATRDDGAWSIPKGEVAAGESLIHAARREFAEETGFDIKGELLELQSVRQPGGKVVHAWAFEGDAEPAALVSGTFTMEWPPRSGRQAVFPEVDRAAWFSLAAARRKILSGQLGLIEQVARLFG